METETDLEALMSSSKLSDPPSSEPPGTSPGNKPLQLVPYNDEEETNLPESDQVTEGKVTGEEVMYHAVQDTDNMVKLSRKSRWDQPHKEHGDQSADSTPERQALKRRRERSGENIPSGQWQETTNEYNRGSVIEYKTGDVAWTQGGSGDSFQTTEQWDTGWEADEKWDEGMSEGSVGAMVTDHQNQMEEKLTELLNKRLGRKASAMEIAKHLGFPSKKGVNPLLYSMQKRGVLKKVQESPPIWQLVKGNAPGSPASHVGPGTAGGRGLGPPGHLPFVPPGGRGQARRPGGPGGPPPSPAELLRQEGHIPSHAGHLSQTPSSLMPMPDKPQLKRPRILESERCPSAVEGTASNTSGVPSLLHMRPSEVKPLDTGLPPDGQLSAPYVDIPSAFPNQPAMSSGTPNPPGIIGAASNQQSVPNQAMTANNTHISQTSSKKGKGHMDSVQSILKKLNSQRRGGGGQTSPGTGAQGTGSAQYGMTSQGFTPPPSPMDLLRGALSKPGNTSAPTPSATNRIGGMTHATTQNSVPSLLRGPQPAPSSAGQSGVTAPGQSVFSGPRQPGLMASGPTKASSLSGGPSPGPPRASSLSGGLPPGPPRASSLSGGPPPGPPRASSLSGGPPPSPAEMLRSSATHGIHNQANSPSVTPAQAPLLQPYSGGSSQSSVPMDQSNQIDNKPVISTKSQLSWVSTPTAPSWAKSKTKETSLSSQASTVQAPPPTNPTPTSSQVPKSKPSVPGIIVKPPQKMQSVNSILKQLNASRKGAYAPGKTTQSQQQSSFQPPPSPAALLGKQTATPRQPTPVTARPMALGGPRQALLGGLGQSGGQGSTMNPIRASGQGMMSSMQAPRPLLNNPLNNNSQPKAGKLI